MQTNQFSTSESLHKKEAWWLCWWNWGKKRRWRRWNYYFNLDFMNCLRARWFSFLFYCVCVVVNERCESFPRSREDFVAIIIEAHLSVHWFGQFTRAAAMHDAFWVHIVNRPKEWVAQFQRHINTKEIGWQIHSQQTCMRRRAQFNPIQANTKWKKKALKRL